MDVVSGMTVQNKDLELLTEQKHHPERIEIKTINGMEKATVQWLVKGELSKANIHAKSIKGGHIKTDLKTFIK